tara:strand:- start:2760 stop:4343 length:1584 start_codon:yes stop_codon:yes gene_type:complete
MGGGLMQLVAYGAQDIYLTGNPQITFFKVVYRRHTNFSMESIQQSFNGNADYGGYAVCTISRNGDLIQRIYLENTFHFDHGPGSDNDSGPDNAVPGIRERYGNSLIKECEIEIGGQQIDKHIGLWNRVYSDLNEFNPTGYFGADTSDKESNFVKPKGSGTLYQLMTGNTYGFNSNSKDQDFFGASGGDAINGITYKDDDSGHITDGHIFIPLNFWFCRNPGLALPLIALQYHEVKIHINFEHERRLLYTCDDSTGGTKGIVYPYERHSNHNHDFKLWVDYIYLDTDERRRFAQVSHEYLIEQLQHNVFNLTDTNSSVELHFNHPVKEMIWCSKSVGQQGRNRTDGNIGELLGNGITSREDPSSGETSLDQMGGEWKLKLNGHDRFSERDTKYFTRTQVWQHHTGYGALPTLGIYSSDFSSLDKNKSILNNGDNNASLISGTIGNDSIAVYSFALNPEEHQPSGTCNFSRIDTAELIGENLKIANATNDNHSLVSLDGTNNKMELTVFAVNYNVLRIMSGMGGLAYSN